MLGLQLLVGVGSEMLDFSTVKLWMIELDAIVNDIYECSMASVGRDRMGDLVRRLLTRCDRPSAHFGGS